LDTRWISEECERKHPIISYGAPLTARDLACLAASWITPDLAEAAGLRRVDSFAGREIVAGNGNADYSGVVFPYYWPGNSNVRAYRLRRYHPDLELQPDGTTKERAKYLSAPGQRPMLYFVPGTDPRWLDDVSIPVVIVEGEKKAISLSRLATHESEQPRFMAIGIAGVWGWRGRVGKTGGPNGESLDVKGPSPDFDRITWERRVVIVLYDCNVRTNESVSAARRDLTRLLQRRQARVLWAEVPDVGN
jgi:Domain of unknown function (DUF3854)